MYNNVFYIKIHNDEELCRIIKKACSMGLKNAHDIDPDHIKKMREKYGDFTSEEYYLVLLPGEGLIRWNDSVEYDRDDGMDVLVITENELTEELVIPAVVYHKLTR